MTETEDVLEILGVSESDLPLVLLDSFNSISFAVATKACTSMLANDPSSVCERDIRDLLGLVSCATCGDFWLLICEELRTEGDDELEACSNVEGPCST